MYTLIVLIFPVVWVLFAFLIRQQVKQKRLKSKGITLWIVFILITVLLFNFAVLYCWNDMRLHQINIDIAGIEAFEDIKFEQHEPYMIFFAGKLKNEADLSSLKTIVERHIHKGGYARVIYAVKIQEINIEPTASGNGTSAVPKP